MSIYTLADLVNTRSSFDLVLSSAEQLAVDKRPLSQTTVIFYFEDSSSITIDRVNSKVVGICRDTTNVKLQAIWRTGW